MGVDGHRGDIIMLIHRRPRPWRPITAATRSAKKTSKLRRNLRCPITFSVNPCKTLSWTRFDVEAGWACGTPKRPFP